MTTQEAIDFYGGRKYLARALDIYPQATYAWGEHPPRAKQFELQVLTNNQLQVEEDFINGTTAHS